VANEVNLIVSDHNMVSPKYLNKIEDIEGLSGDQQGQLSQVTEKYRFRSNDYYLSLIDWSDPCDPIRRIIVPDLCELKEWGNLDPSDEQGITVLPGVEHKYSSTVVLLVVNVCGGICRYCFRKRVFVKDHSKVLTDLPAAVEYINQHKEITNVLMTGGDPLILATSKLEKIVDAVGPIAHVKIIRWGTKMPAFNPHRIINDPRLLKLVGKCLDYGKQLYVMTHFIHINEITDVAIASVKALHNAGAVLCNQTPIIRGVNDNPQAMIDLFSKLSFAGVPPYYVFQCRPSSGNSGYAVPVEEGYRIFEQAKTKILGLAERARFTMSHESGKVEIVGMTAEHIYMKYHRAKDDKKSGSFLIFKRNPDAYWLDDYGRPIESCSLDSLSESFSLK